MPRLFLGAVLAGVAMFLVGFVFWGTPLSGLALSSAGDPASQAVQAALAQHLGPTGTGVYSIPSTNTALGTQLYGQGPTALVQFTNHGFPAFDAASLLYGLVLGIVCALVMAVALWTVSGTLSFARRFALVALIAVAVTAYSDIGQPVFNHAPWGYFVYLWISDVASWLAAGAIVAWFLPRRLPAAF